MDILDILENYVQNGWNARKMLIEYTKMDPQIQYKPLTEVDDGEMGELLIHWLIHQGITGLKYKIYLKAWESRKVASASFEKRVKRDIRVLSVQETGIPVQTLIYRWNEGICYDNLTKSKIDKSVQYQYTTNIINWNRLIKVE